MATQSGTVKAGVAEHQRQRLRSIAIVPQTGCQYALEHGYDIAADTGASVTASWPSSRR
jgi:hypothetical protein